MDPDEASESDIGTKSPIEGKSASDENCSNPDEGSDSAKESTSQAAHMDPKNLHYEGEVCVYTDPDTKYQYQWDNGTQQWTPRGQQLKTADASKDMKPPGDQNYEFDGETYTYTDSTSGLKYKWDKDKNEWVTKPNSSNMEKPKGRKKLPDEENVEENDTDEEEDNVKNVPRQDMSSGHYGFDGENHTYTDPKDGAIYFWDKQKNAWFPKVDDDFMARYQMSYGFVENKSDVDKDNEKDAVLKPDPAEAKRKAQEPPQWFDLDERSNTKVYVSNLPLDITEQEFVDLMQKCGLIMKDADTNKMKVKLYHEPGDPSVLKGDGLCTYIKRESVDLALNILDGYEVKGKQIKVELAKFELKGAYNPSLKPKKKRRKDKEKIKKAQEKLFDWRPDKLRGERSKHEKTVIIKNLFDPEIFDTDVGLILEFQQDLREEASKCGNVRKVIVYDRHKDGVAQINFKDPEEADACVQLFNNRWFNQRRITAETWDGKTKYRVAESAEETEARLAKWTKFLESEEGKKSLGASNHPNDDQDSDEDEDQQEQSSQKESKSDEANISGNKTPLQS
ncbi:HIV Tat-specific factor 1 homolog [Thrips palmi]|uniref:17S U2 SnRNP complex component HTATSF1 n=1 Tax=Thrips palmi TaxID=161013 RepID=A0A6P8ZAQ9_THRPL|nr:HIV Tat-specific factor 1 homolog [Thrips palmi]XP_034247761.1 HIV Tat-specific factor 1 homolog [Thrips palmi]